MKYIKNYEELYSVTEEGQVYSHRRAMYLKPCSYNGYMGVYLCENGKRKKHLIHRLVASAYIENPNDYNEVNHINGIKSDNHVNNLEYTTRSKNMLHAYSTGLTLGPIGEVHGNNKLTESQVIEIKNLLKTSLKQHEIAKLYNVQPQTISLINLNKRWSHLKGIENDT